jgi:tight adherence protein B
VTAVVAGLLVALLLLLLSPRQPGASRLRSLRAPVAVEGPPGPVAVWRRPAGALSRALRRRADADRERARAVEACAALAGELRAGRPPPTALVAASALAVGRTGEALRAAAAAAEVGGDVPEVLTRPAASSAAPELLRGLAACWALCASSGAGLAAAVERLEAAERDALDRRREVRTELAGPRATARMLAGLPVLGLLLAAGLGASPAWLVTTPLGAACLVAGLALDAAGVVWTRRLVDRAERTAA